MIVVLGSRHDSVANKLVKTWPSARLCSAEDIASQGWVWSSGSDCSPSWIVASRLIHDDKISGVFVRRSAVYPEELTSIHPEDRGFLAAEAHAFLIFVLATTQARVVNPIEDGALGDEGLRPERWMQPALDVGLNLSPLRLTSERRRRRKLDLRAVEVVGDEAFGESPQLQRSTLALARCLRLPWATFLFDGRRRLVHVTGANAPSPAATRALGHMLSTRA